MKTWHHRLAHMFGWNRGEVVSALDPYGNVWIGFRCITCGYISGKHIAMGIGSPPDDAYRDGRTDEYGIGGTVPNSEHDVRLRVRRDTGS